MVILYINFWASQRNTNTTNLKNNNYNFIRIMIFVIYYKRGKKVDYEYLYHLIFIFFKFIFKNFIFFKIVSDTIVLSNIFLNFYIKSK